MVRKRSATVKVMGGGRVTIPSEIRDIESIKEGDYLEISIEKIEGVNTGKDLKTNRKTKRQKVVSDSAET